MADPLTGLAGVATVSSILQIIDFSAKCIGATKKLIESGEDALRENIEVEYLTLQHDQLAERLISYNNASRPLTLDEQRVDQLAQECKKESRILLRVLDDLKVERGLSRTKRVLNSAIQTARALRKRKSIEAQQGYLHDLNNQLSIALLQIIKSVPYLFLDEFY